MVGNDRVVKANGEFAPGYLPVQSMVIHCTGCPAMEELTV